MRGHKVTLFEKRQQLGGALIEASIPKFKKDIVPLIDYLSKQVTKLGVKVFAGKEITFQEIVQATPDAVIVATGSKPAILEVPGVNKPHVAEGLDVLRGKKVGERVVIIGGGLVGGEIAWFLADQGKSVVITTRQREIAYNMENTRRDIPLANYLKRMSRYIQGYL